MPTKVANACTSGDKKRFYSLFKGRPKIFEGGELMIYAQEVRRAMPHHKKSIVGRYSDQEILASLVLDGLSRVKRVDLDRPHKKTVGPPKDLQVIGR